MRNFQDGLMFFNSSNTNLNAAFTAAATDICTDTAHGLATGDKVHVANSGTDLPAGLSTSTDYYVVKIDANTFYLNSKPGDSSGDRVDITDAGTGTHTYYVKSKYVYVGDWQHAEVAIGTAGSANFTVNLQGSNQRDVDFEAAASATNRWDYVQMVDKEDGSTVNGDTGFAPAGTDDNKQYAVNVDGFYWLCLDLSAWTAGYMYATCSVYE